MKIFGDKLTMISSRKKSNQTLLGVAVDRSFHNHVIVLFKKGGRKISLLRRLAKLSFLEHRLTLVKAYA